MPVLERKVLLGCSDSRTERHERRDDRDLVS